MMNALKAHCEKALAVMFRVGLCRIAEKRRIYAKLKESSLRQLWERSSFPLKFWGEAGQTLFAHLLSKKL